MVRLFCPTFFYPSSLSGKILVQAQFPHRLFNQQLIVHTFVRRTFGCKWTMALSFIAYMPFILSQLYPRMYTMIPSGLAVGFGGGPLWCAKCTYLTVVAEALAIFNGKNSKSDALVVRFFGLFFIFYQLAQVWGNLISSSGWYISFYIFSSLKYFRYDLQWLNC